MRSRGTGVAASVLAAVFLASCGASSHKSETKEDPVRNYQLGLEHLRRGRPDLAAQLLERAVELDERSPVIRYALGLAYLGLRDLRRAETTFERVLAIDPFFTEATNNLGIVYGELGDFERARSSFERVLGDRRYSTPEVAHYNLGALLLGHGDAKGALAHLKAAATAKPDNADWRYRYGLALNEVGRFPEARTELEAAVAKNTGYVEALYLLGTVCVELKDRGRARECFARVIDLSPGSATAEKAEAQLKQLGS